MGKSFDRLPKYQFGAIGNIRLTMRQSGIEPVAAATLVRRRMDDKTWTQRGGRCALHTSGTYVALCGIKC